MTPISFSLNELASLAEVTPRTVRYYIGLGLLPAPGHAGPRVRYPESHLWRLRVIKRLQRQHLPLSEIRRSLAGLTDNDLELGSWEPIEAPPDSAEEYVRSILGERRADATHPRLAAAGVAPYPTGGPRSPLTSVREAMAGMYARAASPRTGRLRAARAQAPSEPDAGADEPGESLPRSTSLMETPPRPRPATETPSVVGPGRSQWERIQFTPDVELHIRRPLGRHQNRRIDRLIAFARQLLSEDRP